MADGTLGRLFWERVEKSGALPAQLVKRSGQWQTLTWAQAGEVVRRLALGLLALGRKRGEAVALLSTSRADWVQADFAILSAGCVTIPIYPTYMPEQIAYLMNDSETRTLIVEDPAQLVKALEVWARMPALEQIVVMATDYAQLTQHPRVLERVERIVAEKNARLPSYARIKKFAVLPADLSEEAGELTPTQKLKRKLVAEKYGDLLEAVYASPAGARA